MAKLTKEQRELGDKIAVGIFNALKGATPATPKPKVYVNKLAAAMMEYAGSPVDKELLEKAWNTDNDFEYDTILTDFTRNGQITEMEAEEDLNLIFAEYHFINNFTIVFSGELVIPIDITMGLGEQLISSTRNTDDHNPSASPGLIFLAGIELALQEAELRKDIPMQLVRRWLKKPGFEDYIINLLLVELRNDFLRLATNGYADTADTGDFYSYHVGHEKILQSANGSWTNTNGRVIVLGYFGDKITPNKVDIGQSDCGSVSSATMKPSGSQMISIMETLKDQLPDKYKANPDNVFVMSQADLNIYARARIGSVSNVLAEQWRTTGVAPEFEGSRILVNPMKTALGSTVASGHPAPNIYYGPLSEFYFGAQTLIEKDKTYNARGSNGSCIELTYRYYIDFQIRNREAISIAYYGAAVETPVVMNTSAKKSTKLADAAALTASQDVYPYCDTKDARLFVGASKTDLATAQALVASLATAVANLGTGDGKTQEISNRGDAVTIAEIDSTKTYYVFAAFKDGVLTKSSIVSVNID